MASGIIMGNVQGAKPTDYLFTIEWSSVPNDIENASYVTAKSYLKCVNVYEPNPAYNPNVPKSDKVIEINGSETISGSVGIDTRNYEKVLIAQKNNFKILHNSDGKKSINITSYFTANTNQLAFGMAADEVELDSIDRTKAKLNVSVGEITQNEAVVTLTADKEIDGWSYSLDNGVTWREWGTEGISSEGTQSYFVILTHTIFKPNTYYTVRYRVRRKSNHVVTTSESKLIKTLPIYVENINVIKELNDVYAGDGYQNYYSIEPSNASIKDLKITSSNTNIFTANATQFKALKKGKALLTLETADGSEIKERIEIDVKQKVEGIQIETPQVRISPGNGFKINYNIIPSNATQKSVIFYSNNPSVANVDTNGYVEALTNGTAIITVATFEGGFSKNIQVFVEGDYIWHEYNSPIEILTADIINNIYGNILTIKGLLIALGETISDLFEVHAETNTSLIDINDILYDIERNLKLINENNNTTKIKSIYHDETKANNDIIIKYRTWDREDIWRWIQTLNDLYNMLTGKIGKWQILLCNDGIPTINGKKILVRGDLIG